MSRRPPAEALAKSFELGTGVARLFDQAMQDGRTPPLDALEMLARALGRVYRDIAAIHRDPAGCPCGWKPCEGDVKLLAEALREGATPAAHPLPNLQTLEPVGRA